MVVDCTTKRQFAPALLTGLLVLLLAACGGGSSAPAYSNADFVGTYQLVCLGGSRVSGSASASYGFITADGAGTASGMVGENLDGTSSALSNTGNIPYEVQGDGTLLIDNLAGFLACGGDCAVLGAVIDGQDPFACLLIRREGAYSDALLDGAYHLGGLRVSSTGAQSIWTGPGVGFGPVQFDGLGTGTYPATNQNVDGAVTTESGGVANYSIAGDGVLSTAETWFDEGLGTITSDGVFALVGGGPFDGPPFMQFLIEAGAGLSNATLSGEYAAFILGTNLQPMLSTGFTSGIGRVLADGAGVLELVDFTLNDEQSVVTGQSDTETYAVGPDGRLTVSDLEGAVSADGRYAFLVGPNTADDPIMFLLMRRD